MYEEITMALVKKLHLITPRVLIQIMLIGYAIAVISNIIPERF